MRRLCFFFILLLAALPIRADTLILTTGQSLKGKLISVDAKTVVFETGDPPARQEYPRASVQMILLDRAAAAPALPAGLPPNLAAIRQLTGASAARPSRAEPTDEQALAAIQRAVNYLLQNARATTYWDAAGPGFDNVGGETALVLYALLHVGRSLEDARLARDAPQLQPALKWLAEQPAQATYAAGLRANALALLAESPWRNKALQADRRYLETAMFRDGGYTYKVPPSEPPPEPAVPGKPAPFQAKGDLSNGQYAALGAWALAGAKFPLPDAYWTATERYWRNTQRADGSWSYIPGDTEVAAQSPLAMTAAGVATLLMIHEFQDLTAGLAPRNDPNLDRGLAWLNAHFSTEGDAGTSNQLYYLFALERVGLASGLKYIGRTDWFREGAKTLLKLQNADGSWPGTGGGGPNVGTAYGLLFLTRGRVPILFNKLQYDGPWNARHRDHANLTAWLSRQLERPINWQIVSFEADATDWLDAPIVLLTGSADPKFSPEQVAKLKAFIHAGGMIFSTADGGKEAFTQAVRQYAAQICDDKYQMRELPSDHPLFNLWIPIPKPEPVLGLSNGVRELWVHVPQDYGASWQTRNTKNKDHFDLPGNLYFYATGKAPLRGRLQPLTVPPNPQPPRHRITMARVSYPGNWDPEPGAWPRMAQLAGADYRIELKLTTVDLTKVGELDPAVTPLVHLTGAEAVRFTPAHAAALKAYLDRGGLLFADALGGRATFHTSVLDLLKQVYPDAEAARLPAKHTLYNYYFPGSETVAAVQFRKGPAADLGTAPRFLGLTRQNKLRAVLSAEDVTSGLLGTTTWGITGYVPDSAETLVANLLLYAGRASLLP